MRVRRRSVDCIDASRTSRWRGGSVGRSALDANSGVRLGFARGRSARARHGGVCGDLALMKRVVIAIIFLAALGGAGIAYENVRPAAQPKEGPRAPQAVPVVATAAVRKAVPVRLPANRTGQPLA